MLGYLSEQKIAWKPYDEKSVFQQFSRIIKENSVNQTPTCVIKYSATNIKKYVGDDEIWDGLTKLKSYIRGGQHDR
jgi:phage terminase large subunit